MLPLNIWNDIICLSDIKSFNLPVILEWYNKVEDFRFATGIDEPISMAVLERKYAEVTISANEFFAGIYLRESGIMIGLLKGSLKYRKKDAVWINSIAIEKKYRNIGYGSCAVSLLFSYLKVKCGISSAFLSVVEDNYHGRKFWGKLGFVEIRKIEKRFKLKNLQPNVLIMFKNL